MQLMNHTGMVAGYTLGMEPSGRESVVVAVKGTFAIPSRHDQPPRLADEQVPLVEADTFSGEPGFSSPLHEVDYAPVKRRCDVLVVGSAYAPGGKPAERVQVGVKVGTWAKLLDVLGDRLWIDTGTRFSVSRAVPFTTRPITYDIAFGGVDRLHPDESRHDPYMSNPVGIGYHAHLESERVEGTPAPSTEECERPIGAPNGRYSPMSLGPIGRGWQPRVAHAGTYDDAWLEHTFPFLPPDFDDRYYQSAPEDQQINYPTGGEQIVLLNLTPEGRCRFTLPSVDVPVCFFRRDADRVETRAVLDTIVFEPDHERFTLTWRASLALRRNLFEVPEALVGQGTRGWWRARDLGKAYYLSLDVLARERRAEGKEAP